MLSVVDASCDQLSPEYNAAEYKAAVRRMTDRLIDETAGRHPAGHVMRVVARCRLELATERALRRRLDAVEALARIRLAP